MTEKEHIIVLHGIFRTSASMRKLSRFLDEQGYVAHNVGYPSTQYTIQELTEQVYHQIKTITDSPSHKVSIVGYSMGCMIARGLMTHYRPENMGKVVMLGPPNKGSEVADFLKNVWLYQKLYGPAGQQLGTDQSSIRDFLGNVDYDLGVIAGNVSWDPLSSFIIAGADDGKVSVESTKLSGMKDHIILPVTHTFMMDNQKVLHQVVHFLQHGVFNHSS